MPKPTDREYPRWRDQAWSEPAAHGLHALIAWMLHPRGADSISARPVWVSVSSTINDEEDR